MEKAGFEQIPHFTPNATLNSQHHHDTGAYSSKIKSFYIYYLWFHYKNEQQTNSFFKESILQIFNTLHDL